MCLCTVLLSPLVHERRVLTFSSMTVRVLIIRFTLYEDLLSLSLLLRERKRIWCVVVQTKKGLEKWLWSSSLKNYLFLMRVFVHPTLCPNCTDTWYCFNCFYQDLEVFPTEENIFNLKDGREMKEVVSITGPIILKFINKKVLDLWAIILWL